MLSGCVTEKAFPEPDVQPAKERASIHADLAGNYLQRGQLDIAIEDLTRKTSLQITSWR
jgi:hypothetical protein